MACQQMVQHSLTVFYIDRIQPDWLPNWMQRWLVRGATTVMSGLLGCVLPLLLGTTLSVVLAISMRLELSLPDLLLLPALWLLIPGLLGGVIGGIVSARSGGATELLRWSWRDMQVGLGKWLSWGMLLGVLFGVISRAYNPPKNAHALPTSWRVGGMLVGVFVGAILSLFNRFFGRWLFGERSGFLLGRVSLCVMLILGVAGVLGGAQLIGAGIGGMFFIGLSAAFIGIGTGLTRKKMENRQRPNEGIRRAFQSALLAGTCYGFLTALPCAGIYGYIFIPIVWSAPTGFEKEALFFIGLKILAFGVFGASIGGLVKGGYHCLQHVVLRLLFVCNGFAPWHYADFLDYATERIFLRKVGGGYMFIHRYMLEYFASLNVDSKAEVATKV